MKRFPNLWSPDIGHGFRFLTSYDLLDVPVETFVPLLVLLSCILVNLTWNWPCCYVLLSALVLCSWVKLEGSRGKVQVDDPCHLVRAACCHRCHQYHRGHLVAPGGTFPWFQGMLQCLATHGKPLGGVRTLLIPCGQLPLTPL